MTNLPPNQLPQDGDLLTESQPRFYLGNDNLLLRMALGSKIQYTYVDGDVILSPEKFLPLYTLEIICSSFRKRSSE